MTVYSSPDDGEDGTEMLANPPEKCKPRASRSKSMWEMDAVETIRDPKRKELRVRLEALLSGSTISGISQAFSDRKGKYKIFWIVLFALGVLGFVVNFYYITEHFVGRPILTQLQRTSRPFTWPHLTFCNPSNPIPFWKSDAFISKWEKFYDKAHNYKLPRYGPHNLKIWEHYVAMSSINPRYFFQHQHWGMIFMIQAVYKETSVASSSNIFDRFHDITRIPGIFESHLESFRSPIPCYTLMPEKIVSALKLHENLAAVKLYILMDYRSHRIYDSGYESRKLYFFITNPHDTLQSTFPQYILAGTDSIFTIKQKTHERIADCTEETFPVELYNVELTATQRYTGGYDDCRNYLSQRLFVDKCGCYNAQLPLFKFSDRLPRVCTNMTIYNSTQMIRNIECINNVMVGDKATHNFKYQLALSCSKFTQAPCISRSYQLSRNSNSWQDDMSNLRRAKMAASSKVLPNGEQNGTEKYPADNATETFVRRNLVIVNVVAAKDSTEFTYEEYEYPLSQFMSDFGGAIGLWIGLSVISFFEIMELLMVFAKYVKSSY